MTLSFPLKFKEDESLKCTKRRRTMNYISGVARRRNVGGGGHKLFSPKNEKQKKKKKQQQQQQKVTAT